MKPRTYTFKDKQRNNFKYLPKLKLNITLSEEIFKKFLEENKVRFIFQKGFLNPYHRIVDFYIPKKKIIIEIDGGYHTMTSTTKKDKYKDLIFFKDRGFTTIRITNEEVLDGSFTTRKDVISLL